MTFLGPLESRLCQRGSIFRQGSLRAVKIGPVNSTLVKDPSTPAKGPSNHARQKHVGFVYDVFCKRILIFESGSLKHNLHSKSKREASTGTIPVSWHTQHISSEHLSEPYTRRAVLHQHHSLSSNSQCHKIIIISDF